MAAGHNVLNRFPHSQSFFINEKFPVLASRGHSEFLHIIFSFFSPSTVMATSFKLNMKCCFSSWNCSVSTSSASWIRSSHTVSHPQMVSLRVSAESCDINTIFSSYRTPREKPQFTLDCHFQQRNTDS